MRYGCIDSGSAPHDHVLAYTVVLDGDKWPTAWTWLEQNSATIDWGFRWIPGRTLGERARLVMLLRDPDTAIEVKMRFG